MVNKLKNDGFVSFVTEEGGLYKVQVGAFRVKDNAVNAWCKLKEAGYKDAWIKED
jgi:cell division protein FtsN